MYACHTDAVYLYMISSPPASLTGHYINRLFRAETKTTSKTDLWQEAYKQKDGGTDM